MMDYQTAGKAATAELTEKRSRFLSYCFPAASEGEALARLGEVRAQHPAATHHVYAYVLRDNHTARYSDDGEPAKTAGLPVLDVITREGVTDCIIIVVRYFGGTLLGTGGLVRAYGKSARLALDAAGVVTMRLSACYGGAVQYPDWGRFQNIINNAGAVLEEPIYTDAIGVRIWVEKQAEEALVREITDQFSAAIRLDRLEERYFPLPG